MAKKKKKLTNIIPFIYHESKLFKIIKPEIIKNFKPTQEELEESIWYDILNSFHSSLLSIFNNESIKSYFVEIIKNDNNFKNIDFKNIDSFFWDLENVIYFLEHRYISLLEKNFTNSYKRIIENPKINQQLDEPRYIFNSNFNLYYDIFLDIFEILKKNWYNYNDELIIKKELLLFWVSYNEDDIIRFWTKYIISFDEIKLEERYFVDKNYFHKKETQNIEPSKIKYSSFDKNEIKEMFEVKNINIKNIEVNFKFTNYEVVINEKNIYTVIPFISFNKNEDFYNSSFFKNNNILYWEISLNYFNETPLEMKKFNFVKHLLKKVWEKYIFNDNLNIKNSYDVEKFVESIKIEKLKSIDKLNKDEQEKIIKDLSKLDYLVTVYKKFDLKYSFLLAWKPYWDWLYPTIWTTNSLLTRYLVNLQDKISWLWKNFKNDIFFDIKNWELNFMQFIKNSQKSFEDEKTEKLQNIIENVLVFTQTEFHYLWSSHISKILDLKDILTQES